MNTGPVLLLKSIVPYLYLLRASLLFAAIVGGMLLFIGFYLYRHYQRQKKKSYLRDLYTDLIAEIIIAESEEEKGATLTAFEKDHPLLLQKKFPRALLTRELVRTKDSLSGGAAENLRWLYQTLGLDKDTLQRFASPNWHRKAKAIQQLAEMQQNQHLVKIYRETNNRNHFIRTEAQIAVVKLTGFQGLRFLSIVSHPVTQWQQLSLLSQLQEGEIEENNILSWLSSTNESVVEFALRLCQIFRCFALHDAVVTCLQHPAEAVRLQAIKALKEVAGENTPECLMNCFDTAALPEQMLMLEVFAEMEGNRRILSFLTSLLQHANEGVRHRVMQIITEMSPAWSKLLSRQNNSNPAPTYSLLSLQKEAV